MSGLAPSIKTTTSVTVRSTQRATSSCLIAGLIVVLAWVGMPAASADDDLNPRLPSQFDEETFTRELNEGAQPVTTDKNTAPATDDIAQPGARVDSYGSRRFVDVIEIQPATGPRYFLIDNDGVGTPNVGGARNEGALSERRSISKWRLGKW